MTMIYGFRRRKTVHVDSESGTAHGSGSASFPCQTLAQALALSELHGGARILVRAPEGSPVTGVSAFFRDDVTIEGADGTWYSNGIGATGIGVMTLRGCHAVGTGDGIWVGAGTLTVAGQGNLVAEDCYAEGVNGFASVGYWTAAELTRCTGLGTTNDGFNWHGAAGVAGVGTMTDCIGNDCGDEGVSPHDDVILNIVGGEFRRNVQSGMAAVDNAVCNIDGGAEFTDNGGSGVYYEGAATGTLGTYTSTGNAAADVLPAA